MEQKYKRVENLDSMIKDISLPYIEWKVLFLTAEDTSQDELSELIKENSEEIAAALKSLEEKGLIELAESAADEESLPQETLAEQQVAEEQVAEELPMEQEAEEQVAEELPMEQEAEEQDTQEVTSVDITEQDDVEETREETQEVGENAQEETLDIASEIKEESEDLEGTSEIDEESLVPQEEEIEATESEKKAEATELLKELDTSIKFSEEAEQDLESMVPETDVQEEEESEVETAEAKETLTETSEEEAATTDSEEYISDVSKQSILVIDDSIVIRKMIEIALEEEDFRILTATSGKDGMEIIEKEKPNLIILDMILPDMNGIEVLKKIKSEHKSPVIMLSGKDAPQLVESAKEVGVEDFLPKPFRDEELVEKIKNLIQ